MLGPLAGVPRRAAARRARWDLRPVIPQALLQALFQAPSRRPFPAPFRGPIASRPPALRCARPGAGATAAALPHAAHNGVRARPAQRIQHPACACGAAGLLHASALEPLRQRSRRAALRAPSWGVSEALAAVRQALPPTVRAAGVASGRPFQVCSRQGHYSSLPQPFEVRGGPL